MDFDSLQLGLRATFPPHCLSQITKSFSKGKKKSVKCCSDSFLIAKYNLKLGHLFENIL